MNNQEMMEKITKLEKEIRALENRKPSKLASLIGGVLAFTVIGTVLIFAAIVKPYTFTAGTPISASNMNSNFDVLYHWASNIDSVVTVNNESLQSKNIQFKNSGIANPNGLWRIHVGSDDGFYFQKNTSGANNFSSTIDPLYIKANGNVGIGTTSPLGDLHIVGNGSLSETYFDTGFRGDNKNLYLMEARNDVGALIINSRYDNNSFFKNLITLKHEGFVGIGTISPTVPLTINKETLSGNLLKLQVSSGNWGGITFESGNNNMFNIEYGVNPTDTGSGIHTYLSTTSNGAAIYLRARAGGVYIADGATAWTANSDIRLKKDIVKITSALEKIMQIKGVYYYWKNKNSGDIHKRQAGVIAQDILKVIPEIVNIDENGIMGVSYERFTPFLIEGLKELSAQNETLKSKNKELEETVSKMEERLARLESLLKYAKK